MTAAAATKNGTKKKQKAASPDPYQDPRYNEVVCQCKRLDDECHEVLCEELVDARRAKALIESGQKPTCHDCGERLARQEARERSKRFASSSFAAAHSRVEP